MSQRCRGMTLIELLVALTVMSLLAVMAWRGSFQAIAGEQRLAAELDRWQALERTLELIEQDLQALVSPDSRRHPGLAACLEARSTDRLPEPASRPGSELRLLVLAPDGGIRRVAWRQVDERVEWLRWPLDDGAATAQRDVVLDGVRSLSWRYLADGRYIGCWPNAANDRLPAAVALTLEVEGIGRIERLYALR